MHRLINPVPVIGRQTGDFREPVDIERVIEVIVNMLEHAVQTCFVACSVAEVVHVREDESNGARAECRQKYHASIYQILRISFNEAWSKSTPTAYCIATKSAKQAQILQYFFPSANFADFR
jgi:hypothetical protein